MECQSWQHAHPETRVNERRDHALKSLQFERIRGLKPLPRRARIVAWKNWLVSMSMVQNASR